MPELEHGEIVACDECSRARPIETAVVELLGSRIGFGPGGENDAFLERDGEVLCGRCVEEEIPLNEGHQQ